MTVHFSSTLVAGSISSIEPDTQASYFSASMADKLLKRRDKSWIKNVSFIAIDDFLIIYFPDRLTA